MKYFTKEVKIALAAIVAVVLLFFCINFMKGINLFQKSSLYYVKFNDITGLSVSNSVFANGYPVGVVREITYDYEHPGNVCVGIELDEDMRVPVGTKAELEAQVLGGVNMNLILGQNPIKNLHPGDTISGGPHLGALNEIQKVIPQVVKMTPKIDSILDNINRITGDPALMQTLQNAADITSKLKVTAARLDKLMSTDIPQLTARLNRIGGNVEVLSGKLAKVDVDRTMQNVNATLNNVQRLSTEMTQAATHLNKQISGNDNTLGLMLNDRKLYDNINTTVYSADSLLTDIKAHPKRYVHFSVFGKKQK